jgi:ABC-type glutathione transport system ATPase component
MKSDKLDLIQRVMGSENKWTVIAVSNDPLVMAACDYVVVMNNGNIEAEGKFESLMNRPEVSKYFE